MKALPFLALALCATFLLFRHQSVRALDEKSKILETRIAELDGSSASEQSQVPDRSGEAKERAAEQVSTEPGPSVEVQGLDPERSLLELALEVAQNHQKGVRSSELNELMNSLLAKASAEELEALALQIEEMDADTRVRSAMLKTCLGRLAVFHPDRALKLGVGSPLIDLSRDAVRYFLHFDKWMKKDPGEAMTWFDGEVAAGSFEPKALGGKPEAQTFFEINVVSHLLSTDPRSARERLLTLPEEMRELCFRRGQLHQMAETEDAAIAELVREFHPPEKQAEMMGPVASSLARGGGYERVSSFIRNIEASDAEREAIVERTACRQLISSGVLRGIPSDEDISNLQEFARSQVPDKTDYITGRALGSFSRMNRNYAAAAGMVRDLHTANPNDELLVGFLQKRPRTEQDCETARQLAALIRDETRREAALEAIK